MVKGSRWQARRWLSRAGPLALITFSVLLALAACNLVFLVWLRRAGTQSAGFPRQLVSSLPLPSRQAYPDLGATGRSEDVLLLGDSYVEGAGDDFVAGSPDYSIGHHLRTRTGGAYLPFGVGGSFLPEPMHLYRRAVRGELWPLADRRRPEDRPARGLLFFYEGNDLDNHAHSLTSRRAPLARVAVPWSVRVFPLHRFVENRLRTMRPERRSSERLERETKLVNTLCGEAYCRQTPAVQSASPELSEKQVQQGIAAHVEAIQAFAASESMQVCVVYVPAPATVYTSRGPIVFQPYRTGSLAPSGEISGEANQQRSQAMRQQFADAFEALQIPFHDSTADLQAVARSRFLHGENDHQHLGREGQRTLAASIVASRLACLPGSS